MRDRSLALATMLSALTLALLQSNDSPMQRALRDDEPPPPKKPLADSIELYGRHFFAAREWAFDEDGQVYEITRRGARRCQDHKLAQRIIADYIARHPEAAES